MALGTDTLAETLALTITNFARVEGKRADIPNTITAFQGAGAMVWVSQVGPICRLRRETETVSQSVQAPCRFCARKASGVDIRRKHFPFINIYEYSDTQEKTI